MEQQRHNLFSPAGHSPAPEAYARRTFMPEEDSHYRFSGDQSLEAALSRLVISQNFQHQQPPPPPSPAMNTYFSPPAVDTYFDPMLLNSGYQDLTNVGAHSYTGESFGLPGPHRDLTVGPSGWDSGPGVISGRSNGGMYGGEPWYGGGAASFASSSPLHRDFIGGGDDNSVYSYLQRKPFLSGRAAAPVPTLPLPRWNSDGQVNGLGWKFSPLLRGNSGRSKHQFDGISLLDMRGRIVALSRDQTGSKALQTKLDEGPSRDEIEWVLSEVLDYVSDLMKHQSASYFVQKLFGRCSEEQRTRIIVAVSKYPYQIGEIGLNFNGARTLNKLLENLSTPEQISLVVNALCPSTIDLANDPNGQHVIKYCIEHYPYEYHKHIFNEIVNHCYKVSTDKSGCCVLQSCVVHSQGEAQDRLITEIISNAPQLAQDPYGNYVVQHLLGLKMPQVAALLLSKLQGQFVDLSCDKYGSNVVEKFITETDKNYCALIIREILSTPNANSMLVHPFGNFVIQKALTRARECCERDVFRALCDLIEGNSQSMRSNLYGKKILAFLEKKRF